MSWELKRLTFHIKDLHQNWQRNQVSINLHRRWREVDRAKWISDKVMPALLRGKVVELVDLLILVVREKSENLNEGT